jgi:transcriptional regulator with XRE-family HTH domain
MPEKKRISPGPLSDHVASAVRQHREAQRMPYTDLSERLSELGRPIPVLGLRRIEQGERRVDLDDLAALAAALGVPPILLAFPLAAEKEVEILPGRIVDTWSAMEWFAGRAPLDGVGGGDAYANSADVVRLHLWHTDAVDLYCAARNALALSAKRPETWPDSDPARLKDDVTMTLFELVDIRSKMRSRGFPLPVLPPELQHVDDKEVVRVADPRGTGYLAPRLRMQDRGAGGR